MILRSTVRKSVGSIAQVSLSKPPRRSNVTAPAAAPAARPEVSTRGSNGNPLDLRSLPLRALPPDEQPDKAEEKDLVISILQSSPTKRDAKHYLQSFGPILSQQSQKSSTETAANAAKLLQELSSAPGNRAPRVAVVKLREPQSIDDGTFKALVKTLVQLRSLGMPSIVVIDCDHETIPREEWWSTVVRQTERLLGATGRKHSRVADSTLAFDPSGKTHPSPFQAGGISIAFEEPLARPLEEGLIVVVPAYAIDIETHAARPVDSNELVLALTRYLTGMQFTQPSAKSIATEDSQPSLPSIKASVDRVIIIDPLGGTPARYRRNGAHMFLNMIEEYKTAKDDIEGIEYPKPKTDGARPPLASTPEFMTKKHTENLELTRLILAMLPSTSSVIITTPKEAANTLPTKPNSHGASSQTINFLGTTGTRKAKNPLIHNLLTDRPVHSSSLPLGRISADKPGRLDTEPLVFSRTTLAKRGMPLTVIPDPRTTPWVPPKPGAPRLRLTDLCVDLPRLVHLIEDSFGRKLDVQDYLERVSESMAGIIIAGEYEGGAILTWERPFGMDEETAYREGRLVPYLDKFAVLRKSQGAGGVADIVFNAMVRGCLPEGVCWRSRKDNPVNKWYFERSRGFKKLSDSNWTMFWTTEWSEGTLLDYEDVCRNVQPSWADKKHIVD